MFSWLAQTLWPSECAACRKPSADGNPYFCEACWTRLPRLAAPWCACCGAPFAAAAATSHSPDHRCADCREREPSFDLARAALAYDGPAADAIHLFKYQRRRALARPLSRLLSPCLEEVGAVDGVVPVPLHPDRLREREFNQALALAQALCRQTGWPLWWDQLERTRPTTPQVGLDAAGRRRNVRGAFVVARPARVEGRCVALVDDVLTTGSTVNECARALKAAGASRVVVLAVARQLR